MLQNERKREARGKLVFNRFESSPNDGERDESPLDSGTHAPDARKKTWFLKLAEASCKLRRRRFHRLENVLRHDRFRITLPSKSTL